VVALLKPAGLPVMPSELYYEHTVMFVLERTYGAAAGKGESEGAAMLPSPAHRLGAWTTGILLCGRSPAARKSLPRQFQSRTV
jgi:23S rRNA-/tRNA-specific pseudouridylate synthase